MTNEEVDKILSAKVQGGSEVRDWFLPHETDRGLENVCNIVRLIASTKRDNCAPTWQPIDTAPKDRSDVWLFCPNDEPQQCVGFFCNGDGGYWEPTEKLVADVVGAIEPTHWMPLPDAPKVEDGKP